MPAQESKKVRETQKVLAIHIGSVVSACHATFRRETRDDKTTGSKEERIVPEFNSAFFVSQTLSNKEDKNKWINSYLNDIFDAVGKDDSLKEFDSVVLAVLGVVAERDDRRSEGQPSGHSPGGTHVQAVAREGWDEFPQLNLEGIIHGLLRERQLKPCDVDIYNETTCAAVAEYMISPVPARTTGHSDLQRVGAFIRFGRGINACIVQGDGVIPWRGFNNSELGHCIPHIHDVDVAIGYRGECRYHQGDYGSCYEGLIALGALAARVDLGLTSNEVMDVASYYLGQLCHAISTFGVARIAISFKSSDQKSEREALSLPGLRSMNYENMIHAVRDKFTKVWCGYPPCDFPDDSLEKYISCATLSWPADSLTGACWLAVDDRRNGSSLWKLNGKEIGVR